MSSRVPLQTLHRGALPRRGLPCAEAVGHGLPFSTGMEVTVMTTICIFDIFLNFLVLAAIVSQ